MKKICLIIHSLGIGGMERVMYQLLKNFSVRDSVEIHLILIGRKREIHYAIPDQVIIHTPGFEFGTYKRIIDIIRTGWFIRQKIKAIDPITILSFGEYWNNLVLLSLYGLKNPIFISDRSQPNKDLGNLQNFLRNKLYPNASGYIAQTQEAKKVCLANKWNENVKIIGNPIPSEFVNPSQAFYNKIILSVGRLVKTKNFDLLIKIFAEIKLKDWKLIIVGGNAQKQNEMIKLKNLITELRIGNRVILTGAVSDVRKYYQMSSIFAFASSSEGFPNVIGEAMSAGLPVISFDCIAGPSELIEDGENGYLIPLFDTSLYKKKLETLMKNHKLREKMGEYSANKIKEFSIEKICNEFYNFILNKR